MKPFTIELSSIEKGPKELEYQLPIAARVLRQIPGKDRPDYFLAELDSPIVWTGDKSGEGKEITHVVICTKYKEHDVAEGMKNILIAVAYVIENSQIKEAKVDFKKCKYMALGHASAKGKWNIFG